MHLLARMQKHHNNTQFKNFRKKLRNDGTSARDFKKENYLIVHDIRVLRFENKWVFHDLEYVLKKISTAFDEK